LSAFLVDSNVLVYAHDPRDRAKQLRALEVLDHLITRDMAVLSVQCLTEFFRAARWKLPEPLAPEEALAQVERFTQACRILDLTPLVVIEGCRGTHAHSLALWDSLIWSVAKLNQVPYILSEDFPGRSFIEGVRFLNPFAPDFDLAVLETQP
jgi:predicted nucleic acid-binding protein